MSLIESEFTAHVQSYIFLLKLNIGFNSQYVRSEVEQEEQRRKPQCGEAWNSKSGIRTNTQLLMPTPVLLLMRPQGRQIGPEGWIFRAKFTS